MPHRPEITLKPALPDPEGHGICRKARGWFGIELEDVRSVQIVTIDAELSGEQLCPEIYRN